MSSMQKPYQQHLTCSDDLITSYEATRAGFVALALEKNRQATPFIEQARALKIAASKATKPMQLFKIKAIQPALLIASGVSDKASKHILLEDKKEAIQRLIKKYLEPEGEAFVEELVYRFLLTQGDALGGSMRNVGGQIAQRKFTRAIISSLTISGITCHWLPNSTSTWIKMPKEDADIELQLRGLGWTNRKYKRTVLFNLTVPLTRNNVDLCLFNCSYRDISPSIYKAPKHYLALGELKGGIDPAGADEHWKTARTAPTRLREAFSDKGLAPKTLFVGASIQKKMSSEIWSQLESGTLGNAANLTNEDQVASISRWLCDL